MFHKVVWQHARCGRIFNNHFTENLLQNQPIKEFCKSVKIWQRYHEYGGSRFMEHDVYSKFSNSVDEVQYMHS